MTTHVLQTLPPLAVGAQQPAAIDPILNLCTRYPLRLGRLRQCGIRSLPDTSTHDQHWESGNFYSGSSDIHTLLNKLQKKFVALVNLMMLMLMWIISKHQFLYYYSLECLFTQLLRISAPLYTLHNKPQIEKENFVDYISG